MTSAKAARPYLYEVDLLRAITSFSVVAIHALSASLFLVTSPVSIQFANLIIHLLHFNRELFMFITGLVLVHVYHNNPSFSAKHFWRKRLLLICIPYILWTVIYTVANHPAPDMAAFIHRCLVYIFNGDASPQLYYIVLAMQFYAIFPLFLKLLRKVEKHSQKTIMASFIIQLVMIALDYYLLQTGPFSQVHSVQVFVYYQNRFFFLYQLYFVLGAFAALHLEAVKTFLVRHGRQIAGLMLAAFASYSAYYLIQINWFDQTLNLATNVLQPSVVLYSVAVIAFFGWLALCWKAKRRAYRLVKAISDVSFGIFFVHFLVLTYLVDAWLPHISAGIPASVRMAGLVVVTFGISVAICWLISRIALLSWTIGRVQKPVRRRWLWL